MKNALTMRWMLLSISLLTAPALRAQKTPASPANPYARLDARAMQLPESETRNVASIATWMSEHFPDEIDRTRAIFAWITGNIQYDIDNMFAINFYADTTETISKPLLTRKGICENYALLFRSICNRTGIPCVEVVGFTRQKSSVDYLPHAWCVAKMKGGWRIFDPTWGSGGILNGKFIRRLNNEYFNAAPESFIKTHMPFDYLWQLLYYPVTNQEFYEGKTAQDKTKPYFNYPDSIAVQLALPDIEQKRAEAGRVEKNGVRNSLVFDRLQHLKVDLENYRRKQEYDQQSKVVDAYNRSAEEFNAASRQFNDGVRQFNLFINYRNGQFKPAKSDAEIRQMLDSADHLVSGAKAMAIAIANKDEKVQTLVRQLVAAVDELQPRIADQQEWLKKYLGKGKLARKMMFY